MPAAQPCGMRKSFLQFTVVALALTLLPASRAAAAQIDFTGGGKAPWVVTFSLANDPLGNPFSDWVGELDWSWIGGTPADYEDSIFTCCVDATQYLRDPQTVALRSTNDLTTPMGGAGKRVAWLVNQFANQVHTSGTAAEVAGLQVAIWEAEYDTTGNLSGGNFQLVTTGSTYMTAPVLSAANRYLRASYSNPLPGGGASYYTSQATFLDTAYGQGQVMASPVPEPASLLLVASGAAAALARRRRNKNRN
jgi:PEP-CTERM motif